MKARTKKNLEDFFKRNNQLIPIKKEILEICEAITYCYENGGQVLICGNGGSSSDSDHIVGELMKGFLLQRPLEKKLIERFKSLYGEYGEDISKKLQRALPAISLNTQTALISAFNNDVDPDLTYAQQVMGYGRCGDIVIGISTSGNAINVYNALITGKAIGAKTIAFTGRDGGKISKISDYSFIAPEKETYLIQEYHLIVYHFVCMYVESELFDL
ncbi:MULTISPECIES: SIS domain-containing protein [Clostridium]|jgi:D-sedoheptulose 7-phosphate isomerase|uniref:Phosphoheptose isomerase 1 n=1 Tax=bioreactor metagenome TaxID=1076179 RepID=A0A644ZD85_9ZZZZ|nr:SIS domain-containing protein [Clostridium sp. C8]KLE15358.1 phosphoheptose isomerase [Clostridium sp. C8]